jgi:hypothetical protein
VSTRVYAPLGMLGYGFPERSLRAAMDMAPHALAVDAGSVDPGPYYLGAGVSFTNEVMVHRDLSLLLPAALRAGVPLIIGSAGGAGARPHLELTRAIVERIAAEQGLRFRMAVIPSDIPVDVVQEAVRDGRIVDFEAGRELTPDDVASCRHLVGQMGVEPFLEALTGGAQVVLAGRAYDAAGPAALPILEGADRGLAFHLGKIVECGSQVALPRASDGVIAEVFDDHFEITPADPEKRSTVALVAGHTLYEKADPFHHGMPGGHLDLREATFEQLDERRVTVRGSRFVAEEPYAIKLEGAAFVGHRAVCLAGVRDPILLEHLDEMLDGVRRKVAADLEGRVDGATYQLRFRVFGHDGVMGDLEPSQGPTGHEAAVLIDVTAGSPQDAATVAALARSASLHMGYEGRKATAGNLAFPFSPAEFPAPDAYEFRVYHLLSGVDPTALFPITWVEVDGRD